MHTKYTLAGLGLTVGLAVAAAAAPALATLDGIGVALVPLLIGAALVLGGHIIDRRFTK